MKSARLAPVYDVISTAVYESAARDMSICLGHESCLDKIGRETIAEAASEAGISEKIALRRLDSMASVFEKSLNDAAGRLMDEGFILAHDLCEKILLAGGYRNL